MSERFKELVLNLQKKAEEALAAGLPPGNPDDNGITQPQGALVAMDPATGFVLAMVGGRDYRETQFNRATALRQPGSAFKPFVYLAALEEGYTLVDSFMCEEVEFVLPETGEVYRPTNYGPQPYHNRPFTLREALVTSNNVVSTRLNYEMGPGMGNALARRLGIESPLEPNLSSALGTSEVTPLELTGAFCALANGGKKVVPLAVIKVSDSRGRVLVDNRPRLQQTVNPAAAYLITDVLKGVLAPGGTASNIGGQIDWPAAGKTGTTQNYGNAWFTGYTPTLVATVWVGNDRASEPVGGTGARLAAPIWADFVRQALAGSPARDFARPRNVVSVEVCTESNLQASWWCPEDTTARELFVAGTEPWRLCDTHSPLRWHWLERLLPSQWDRPREIPDLPAPEEPRDERPTPRQPRQLSPPQQPDPGEEEEPLNLPQQAPLSEPLLPHEDEPEDAWEEEALDEPWTFPHWPHPGEEGETELEEELPEAESQEEEEIGLLKKGPAQHRSFSLII